MDFKSKLEELGHSNPKSGAKEVATKVDIEEFGFRIEGDVDKIFEDLSKAMNKASEKAMKVVAKAMNWAEKKFPHDDPQGIAQSQLGHSFNLALRMSDRMNENSPYNIRELIMR